MHPEAAEPKQPYPFQRVGVNFLIEGNRRILADKVGLGKTGQALLATRQPQGLPCLVVAPKTASGVWVNESKAWLGLRPLVYQGQLSYRHKLLERIKKDPAPTIVITNYALMDEILHVRPWWNTIIFDEAHALKNPKAKTRYKVAKNFSCKNMFLLTATPMRSGAKDIWTLLNLCAPWEFPSYWKFVNRYAFVYDNGFGKVVEGTNPLHTKELRQILSKYMLRRSPDDPDVNLELPPKRRQFIPVEMTPLQAKSYAQMAQSAILEINSVLDTEPNILVAPNVITMLLRLRQLLVHPDLLGAKGESGALEVLYDELRESDEPVIIFVPFVDVIPIISSQLREYGYITYPIHGKITADQLSKSVESFQRGGKKAIIATLQMGQSWTATAAHVCYMVGFDWSPDTHEQAEGRLHRISQRHPVLIKYLTYEGTVDQHLRSILGRKITWQKLALDPTYMLTPFVSEQAEEQESPPSPRNVR